MPGIEAYSPAVIAWIVGVIVLAGLLQGTLGFGFPFVATPLVAMATDIRTAVITVLLPTLATTIATMATAGPLRPVLARFWPMPLYAIAGSLVGTWIFVAAPGAPYSLLLAVIIIVYLNIDRFTHGSWPLVQHHERAFAPLAGLTGGLFEGTVNVAAPPLIMYYLALGLTPATLVQALCICFIVGKTTQFAVLTLQGGVSAAQWIATLPFAALGVITFFAGARMRNRIDAMTFRVWVKRALFGIALVMLGQFAYARWL